MARAPSRRKSRGRKAPAAAGVNAEAIAAKIAVSIDATAVGNALVGRRDDELARQHSLIGTTVVLHARLPVSPERLSAALYVQILARFFGGLRGRAGDRDGRP
jgi:hypothetical protein